MLPTRLNLLSPQKRDHLKRMVRFQFGRNTLEFALFTSAIVATTLLVGWFVLHAHLADVKRQLGQGSTQRTALNERISQINAVIKTTDTMQARYTAWSPIVVELGNAIPDGVVIKTMEVDGINNAIAITGVAQTRDDLLRLKASLEALAFVGEITIPLSQLVKKENVGFAISTELIREGL